MPVEKVLPAAHWVDPEAALLEVNHALILLFPAESAE